MSRINVDLVISRVLGEESFRRAFLENRAATVRQLRENGLDLTESESERLRSTNWTMLLKLIERLPAS